MSPLELFYYAISRKRPYGGAGAGELMLKLARLAPGHMHTWLDGAGNLHIDNRQGKSKSLFVAHTDTMHRAEGHNQWCQVGNMVYACFDVLGADDAAGMAVLWALIQADKPGYYIYIQGEEQGGIGSKWLAENWQDGLIQFDRAIAFDRKDVYSVITHQGGQRCCSDAFGEALANALNDQGLLYTTDNTGVYTDTAEFVDIVPECTNLSAGYWREHSREEMQDVAHLEALCEAVVSIDWEGLPTKRDPEEAKDEDKEFEQALAYAANDMPMMLEDWLITNGYCTVEEAENTRWHERAKEAKMTYKFFGLEEALTTLLEKEETYAQN